MFRQVLCYTGDVYKRQVYVSGSTVVIYMETDGVLIIDTGEILSEEGISREPAKNVVKPVDYMVAFKSQVIHSKRELIEDIRAPVSYTHLWRNPKSAGKDWSVSTGYP